MGKATFLIGLGMAMAGAAHAQHAAMQWAHEAGPDTTYALLAARAGDTVTVRIDWKRPEKDKADIRLDVLDMEGKLHKTLYQKARLAPHAGSSVRFVLNPARELGLDTAGFYYVISSNLSCSCEDLHLPVLAAAPESYAWPEPGLRLNTRRQGRRTYLLVTAENIAKDVRLTLPAGHPGWKLTEYAFDLLPGQEREIEILGLAPGEAFAVSEVRVEHR